MVTKKPAQHLTTLVNMGLCVPKLEGGQDQLVEAYHGIENLDAVHALKLAEHCADARGFNAFVLGGALLRINESEWYSEYGYASFKDFVTNGLGMSKSAAYDYMKIYDSLVNAEVSWNQVESVGWTKLRWIARYLEEGNIDTWVKAAESMNTHELQEFAKAQAKEAADKALVPKFQGCSEEESTHVDTLAANDDVHGGKEEADKVPMVTEKAALETPQTKIFKLYPEQLDVVGQALDMAMKDSGTQYQNVGLERICMYFLANYQPDPDNWKPDLSNE